ncbi:MAG: LON peptidase substrate-binding domain-containing protein [Lewinella sp.]|nr:LON peptidase substrate-binding domain-containing protein [Lewinella sp.]
MKRQLALFPLQIVVFPGESLNLHIFEPRYRELLQDCEATGMTFGIPAYIDGAIQEVGTEVKLVEVVKRYPNGELDIRTRGEGLFRLFDYQPRMPGKLYAGGEIEELPFDPVEDPALNERIRELTQALFTELRISKSLPERIADFRTYDVAHHVGFKLEQEYEFLTLFDAAGRQQFLIEHLETLLPIVREMERVKEKAKLNGHFRNIIPPEV